MSSPAKGVANPYNDKPGMLKINSGAIITGLLVLLCSLAVFDIWTQFTSGDQDYWSEWYSLAIRSDAQLWNIGFRIEDVQIRAEQLRVMLQKKRSLVERIHVPNVRSRSRSHPIDVEAMVRRRGNIVDLNRLSVNTSSIFTISCGDVEGPPLRVGYNDYLTSPETACKLFNGLESEAIYPHYMFERIELDEGSFALRSISSSTYLSTMPPVVPENPDYSYDYSSQPWSLVVGSPTVGVHERFRLTDDHFLYSSILSKLIIFADVCCCDVCFIN